MFKLTISIKVIVLVCLYLSQSRISIFFLSYAQQHSKYHIEFLKLVNLKPVDAPCKHY